MDGQGVQRMEDIMEERSDMEDLADTDPDWQDDFRRECADDPTRIVSKLRERMPSLEQLDLDTDRTSTTFDPTEFIKVMDDALNAPIEQIEDATQIKEVEVTERGVALLGDPAASGGGPQEIVKEVHIYEKYTIGISNQPPNQDAASPQDKTDSPPPSAKPQEQSQDSKNVADCTALLENAMSLLEKSVDVFHELAAALHTKYGAEFLDHFKSRLISTNATFEKVMNLVQKDAPQVSQFVESSVVQVPEFLSSPTTPSDSTLSLVDDDIQSVEVDYAEQLFANKPRRGSYFLTHYDDQELNETSDACEFETDFYKPVKLPRPVKIESPPAENSKVPFYQWLAAEKDPDLSSQVMEIAQSHRNQYVQKRKRWEGPHKVQQLENVLKPQATKEDKGPEQVIPRNDRDTKFFNESAKELSNLLYDMFNGPTSG